MQNYFVKHHQEKRAVEKQRLDLDKRGVNWHQNSLGVYKDGSLHFSKTALERMERGDIYGGAFAKPSKVVDDGKVKMRAEQKHRAKMSYEEIMKAKESNEEFRTGKRFKKSRGAAGKIHRKKK